MAPFRRQGHLVGAVVAAVSHCIPLRSLLRVSTWNSERIKQNSAHQWLVGGVLELLPVPLGAFAPVVSAGASD